AVAVPAFDVSVLNVSVLAVNVSGRIPTLQYMDFAVLIVDVVYSIYSIATKGRIKGESVRSVSDN
ncbi:Hypothetical protein FKW44_018065, partial [Caligus rogercresseyi]